jgi:hypothetical protein
MQPTTFVVVMFGLLVLLSQGPSPTAAQTDATCVATVDLINVVTVADIPGNCVEQNDANRVCAQSVGVLARPVLLSPGTYKQVGLLTINEYCPATQYCCIARVGILGLGNLLESVIVQL